MNDVIGSIYFPKKKKIKEKKYTKKLMCHVDKTNLNDMSK